MNHKERKAAADAALQTKFFYTYVLQFDYGGSYVGSTNEPLSRFTEHAVGVGAEATMGRMFTVRLVNLFETRKEAEYNEKRIQRALAKGPRHIQAMIDNFARITDMVRPQKTLRQLEDEGKAYEEQMREVIHRWRGTSADTMFGRPKETECGLNSLFYAPRPGNQEFAAYSFPETFTWEQFRSSENACPNCLTEMPDIGHASEECA